ncbi:catalytic protein [Penicillium malachiteum]|uniref:catalytic protein n=1 Tax=Penicillium malachiteum TaxID=1324776 RepID=UPI0025473471|nr:catalytic protein [Penicillium malachiteum]KAJ5737861.1 catalytic protein [Penicillium malachiteum]
MANIPPKQIHAVLPSTVDTYQKWTTAVGGLPDFELLSDGKTRLLWLGRRKAKNVLLFFHEGTGGGYVMPLSPGHLDWMAHIKGEASKADIALDIIFGGDSAGGHISLSLLSCLHHPRPRNLNPIYDIEMTEPVKGCFLVSPLTSLNLNTMSFRKPYSVDVLGKEVVSRWGDLLIKDSPWQDEISRGYGWGMALDVSESWWEGLNSVDGILITTGEEEVFRDHIIQLIDVFKCRAKSNVTSYIADKETHDGPLMDFLAQRAPSLTTQHITQWIIAQLHD